MVLQAAIIILESSLCVYGSNDWSLRGLYHARGRSWSTRAIGKKHLL